MHASIGNQAFDTRARRARLLAAEHHAVADILIFYGAVSEYQRDLSAGVRSSADAAAKFADTVDVRSAAAAVSPFVGFLERHAPAVFGAELIALRDVPVEQWGAWMREALLGTLPPGLKSAFVVEAVLQPFADGAAAPRRERLKDADHAARCPVCGDRPVVGALREEGYGAKRTLVCGLCLTEWAYRRIMCPSCGEQRFDALPVYTSERYPHVRIDACDTCHAYIKTIDLTKSGLAVPLADDLASLPLDLWARERGYTRLRPHLIRT